MVDQATLDKLNAGFKKLQDAKDCKSLLKQYLTKDVFERLKTRNTTMGATLLDIIESGVENLDSGVGLSTPDAESYTLFADLFNPMIDNYHGGFKAGDKLPTTNFGDRNILVNVDPDVQFVISTRVRCGPSLQGYPFNPCLREAQYREMEEKVRSTLRTLRTRVSRR
ncbi:arginine kinase-like [Ixodes scapularis]|uniref:arginine kinase-like n=1 Tax=Ixodes scapularis TaxID=6945 RepID=UPI001A9E15D4|nr:arginine kinase-like [Ixodes scapularis]